MRLALVGGGGFRVPLVYRTLLRDQGPGRVSELALIDTDPQRLAVMQRVLADQAREVEDAPVVTGHTDLAEGLAGADFVFSAMRVGGLAGRVADEQVALAHGVIGQETIGAGGIAYALRTIPVAMDLARTIAEVAPQAWTINFTNPAGVITQAMAQVLGDKVIGICDSPIGLARHVAGALGLAGQPMEIDYVGLNHLGWLRGLQVAGRPVLGDLLLDDQALTSFEEGRLFGPALLRDLSAIPNEYLYYYYFARDVLQADLAAADTRGSYLHQQQDAFYTSCTEHTAHPFAVWDQARLEREQTYGASVREAAGGMDRDEQDLESGGYDAVALAIMRAISRDEPATLILNVPNRGRIAELDDQAVVEVPCRVSAQGVQVLPGSPLPREGSALVQQIKFVEECEIEAATTGSAAAALRALRSHPLIDSVTVARDLLAGYRAAHPGLAYLR